MPAEPQNPSIDPDEIARFQAMAAEWWDPTGKFRPLHKFNPARLGWIKQEIADRFGRDPADAAALTGLDLADIGCGGGLIAEPMARLGAKVVGIDASEGAIEAARIHAAESGLAIDYRLTTAEELVAAGGRFDVVLALEIVEHVPDMPAFVASCAELIKPGGLMVVSTINRTPKAWALAIFGAEVVLRWLPRGTHNYDKLITPDELTDAYLAAGLAPTGRTGVVYNPLADRWRLSNDLDVNYMLAAEQD